MLSLIEFLHSRLVFGLRARVLSASLATHIPAGSKVLDVGCGNGIIAHLIQKINPTVSFQGLEVNLRPSCLIQCAAYDGATIPLSSSCVDVCMFVDVLHHTVNIEGLLKEAQRVTSRYVLIKDHLCETKFDKYILSFMDWIGNRPYGVHLPYNYQSKQDWRRYVFVCGLGEVSWNENLPLYPFPLNYLFGRKLHFVALLEKS